MLLVWTAMGMLPGVVDAQPLERPREYRQYDPHRVETYSENEIPDLQVWKVKAIRGAVPLWRTEAMDARAGELRFLEELTVLAVQPRGNQWIFQVGDCSAIRTDVADAQRFTVRGWVKGEDLLLVSLPLRSPNGRIPQKVIAMPDYKKYASQSQAQIEGDLKLSWNPLAQGADEAQLKQGNWVYIFANRKYRNEEWHLVASKPDLGIFRDAEDARSNNVVVGWVRKSVAFPWDTREALQPYRLRRIPAPVFRSRNQLNDASARASALWSDPVFETPPRDRPVLPASKPRFPIIGKILEPMAQVPIFHARVNYLVYGSDVERIAGGGAATQSGGDAAYDPEGLAARIARGLKKFNLIFVLDGTQSMAPYFERTKQVIESLANDRLFRDMQGSVEVRFGAVVYRDNYAGDGIADKIPLQKDAGAFLRTLMAAAPPDTAVPQPDNLEEALNYGLHQALTGVITRDDEDAFNLVLVLGDNGTSTEERFTPQVFRKTAKEVGSRLGVLYMLGAVHVPTTRGSPKFLTDMTAVRDAWFGSRPGLAPDQYFEYPKGGDPRGWNEASVVDALTQTIHNAVCTRYVAWKTMAIAAGLMLDRDDGSSRHPCMTGGTRTSQSTGISMLINYAVDMLVREGVSAAEAQDHVQRWIDNDRPLYLEAWVPVAKPSKEAGCAPRERTAEGCVDLAMERMVFFTNQELNEYLNVLQALGNNSSQREFQDFWKKNCAQVAAESAVDMTVAKCLDYRFGTTRLRTTKALDVHPDRVTSEQLNGLSREAREKYRQLNTLFQDANKKDSPNWAENLSGVKYTWISEFDLL